MPELPEVETTRRGIEPHLVGQAVTEVIVRHRGLRQPVSETLDSIAGERFTGVTRRAKYLILTMESGGYLLIHLGMSGSLRLADPSADFKKHDHVALTLGSGKQLRFHDPRRFGIFLHLPSGDPQAHPLLKGLGPEPLDAGFTAAHLAKACAGRKIAIKLAIMDPKVVVGVGNIYASEALFRAGIRPATEAAKITRPKLAKLVEAIRQVLTDSIEQGGTTLRDFLNSDGEPGYFRQSLFVYERKGEPCRVCGTAINHAVMGQRSTYWCPKCQR
ncbi:bifunctional DNA-formamidopyrimidine glycosylase/DNA-(apurinic or apyrimidinic site) lyase [Luteolibacter flavescens]|uniref:Formamidopyrimidine-DNA glycosylase n=1 Tax=Luteolibacter flavescens TaxID=1859460 RepID=A0ABT3FLD6_9BACT|nr:bifunctional DNA-formamidopyrimidine glycosylase/DNA-(apurinic or apyrimidinic site) lyase [Luteolibacter flavescens]MCW1884375.1 bifunctional DNA-formamidopyrimidine glycosylase/DNA-(apurinic or apyrimidinic site) lyase [Luteolibacter flavescens]